MYKILIKFRYSQTTHHTINKKNRTIKMASTIRFPFTQSDMLQNQLPNKKVDICSNPEGTKPVPYKNYEGSHPMGSIITTDGKYTTYYLMWYVWEFLGHLSYLSNDFESFMLEIVEKGNHKDLKTMYVEYNCLKHLYSEKDLICVNPIVLQHQLPILLLNWFQWDFL